MKKIFFIVLALLPCVACENQNEKAQVMYNRAQQLFSEGSFASAKITIDSIQMVYPKAFDVIRDGMQLMRKVNLCENERTLAFTDSMIVVKEAEAEPLKKSFIYEKDTVYQNIGNYVHKLQKLERNVERTYLRSQVDEKGNMQLASVYFGKSPIKHSAVRLELNDGTFAETLHINYDGGNNYRFEDNGNTTEVVTYKEGKDNGVVDFISLYGDKRIKVKMLGGKSYIFYLDDQTKKAIAETQRLAIVLSDLERLKLENRKAAKGIELLNKRIDEKTKKEGQ